MATTDINGMIFYTAGDIVTPLQTTLNAISTATTNALDSNVRLFKVADQTARDALAVSRAPSASNPLRVYRQDTKAWESNYGGGWVSEGSVIPAASSSARDAIATWFGPSTTHVLYVDRTDLGVIQRNAGSGWTPISGPTVRFKGYLNGGTTVASTTNIPFNVAEDTHSGWNAGTNAWTCPVAGTYLLIGSLKNNATGAASSIRFLRGGGNIFASPNFASQPFGGGGATYYATLAVGNVISMQSGASFVTQSDAPADNNFFQIILVQN